MKDNFIEMTNNLQQIIQILRHYNKNLKTDLSEYLNDYDKCLQQLISNTLKLNSIELILVDILAISFENIKILAKNSKYKLLNKEAYHIHNIPSIIYSDKNFLERVEYYVKYEVKDYKNESKRNFVKKFEKSWSKLIDELHVKKNEEKKLANNLYIELLKSRIIYLNQEINDKIACSVVSGLILLNEKSQNQEVKLYINNVGGDVTSALAIYDTMKYIKAPIKTIGFNNVSGISLLLLATGDKNNRFITQDTFINMCEFTCNNKGKDKDIEKTIEKINKIWFDLTKQNDSRLNFNRSLSNYEIISYGIVDYILEKDKIDKNFINLIKQS